MREEARRIYGRIVESRAPGGRIEISHEPIGVAAAFTAWNFPAFLIARKVAPALAAGCSIIVRPSREVPGTAMILVDCVHQAGVPAGVINLVIGPTSTTYDPIMASKAVRKISLTGSTAIGQQMIRDSAATLKRVSMELGGNAPVMVFEDANVDQVLDLSVPVKFANAGQVCVTADRFYVHESLQKAFTEGFAARAKALKLGHGLDETTQMGPLINQRRVDAMEAIVADAKARGGKIETGGGRPAGQNKGFFFEPTVITGLPDDARAMADENFGPIAAITGFATADEAYARANGSEYRAGGLCLHPQPRPHARGGGPARSRHGRRQLLCACRRRSALRRHQGQRHGPRGRLRRHPRLHECETHPGRGLGDTRNDTQWHPPSLGRRQARPQRLALDRQFLHCRDHGGARL